MNWISLLSQIFFCVLVTSATGSVMLFIWFLCRKFLQNKNPKLVYYMLRWVVIMFLLPITYVGIVINYETGYVQDAEGISKMMFVVDLNNLLFQGLAMIWFIVTAFMVFFFLKNEIGKHYVCKNNFDDGSSLAQTEFERIKNEVGVKGRVVLLRNDNPRQKSPFVVGMWTRKVVVPYLNYTKEELDVILYHELNHIKKSDILFRYLTMFAIMINSINPFSYPLWNLMLLWSEADCDARAVDGLEKEGITKKQYYDIIWKLMGSSPAELTLFYYPMLHGAAKSLYRRMEIMEKYRVNMKKVAKSVTFAWVMVFAMLSTVTAHAAGIGIAEANDEALKETQIVGQHGTFVDDEDWSKEMLIPASDVVDIVYVNDEIMTLGEGSFSWDVPVGTRYVTSSIYMTKGTVIQIACTGKPSDCTYWFGLMYASSECAVVEGSGSGSHDFTVPSTGYYRVMVENRGSTTLHVVGSYLY